MSEEVGLGAYLSYKTVWTPCILYRLQGIYIIYQTYYTQCIADVSYALYIFLRLAIKSLNEMNTISNIFILLDGLQKVIKSEGGKVLSWFSARH